MLGSVRRTMESDNREDKHNGEGHDHDGVDLEPRGLISVKPCTNKVSYCIFETNPPGSFILC